MPAINKQLMAHSSFMLSCAVGVGLVLGFAMFVLEGGREAVSGMGGIHPSQVPLATAQWVLLLDILFPVSFGSGLMFLVTALQTRGNRPLVRMILTCLFLAVTTDFIENALVFKVMAGGKAHAMLFPVTLVKYAMIAFAGALTSAIIPRINMLGNLAFLILRFFFPLCIGLLVTGIGGAAGQDLISASFPLVLLIMAIYTRQLSMIDQG